MQFSIQKLPNPANVPSGAAGERVVTVEELAKRFNVSTKTISRWRRQGLVSRRFVIDGRKRVGFLQSSVDRFVEHEPRAGAPRAAVQPTDATRSGAMIIERARRLASAGGCPADVTKRLAEKTGRSTETIRYTLKQFDHDHPEAARFPDNHGPLQTGDQTEDLSAVSARRVGRGSGQAVLPHADQHLPDHRRDARPADHGIAAGLSSPTTVCRRSAFAEAREVGCWAPMPRSGRAAEESRGCPAACRPTWPACTRCRC